MALRLTAVVLVGVLATGCATRRPPDEIDLREAFVAAGPKHEFVVVNGSSVVKLAVGRGAAVGATMGAIGLPASVPLCLAAFGPLMGACVMAFVPAAGGIGASAGALSARAQSETREEMLARRDAVRTEMETLSYDELLAEHVRQSLQRQLGAESGVANATTEGPVVPSPKWKVEPVVFKVAMYGTLEDAGFKLRVQGRLRVRRASDDRIVYRVNGLVYSDELVGPVAPGADTTALIRTRLESCLPRLSEQLVAQLLGRPQMLDNGVEPEDNTDGSTDDSPAPAQVALAAPQ